MVVKRIVPVVIALGLIVWILWRSAREDEEARVASAPTPAQMHAPDGLVSNQRAVDEPGETPDSLQELRAAISALEQRVRLLEERPVPPDRRALDVSVSDEQRLRDIVHDVLAENARNARIEGERRAREDELRALEQAEAEMRFQLGLVVRQVSERVELLPEEEERLVDVLVDYHRKQEEVTRSVDPLETDPEAFERRLEEVREWLRRELENELGVEVASRILEHFG